MRVDTRRIYEGDEYRANHEEWHASHGPGKALDIFPGVAKVIASLKGQGRIRILEVGCGTGAILAGLSEIFDKEYPGIQFELNGIDIAQYPLEIGREKFPDINLEKRDFFDIKENFDIVMFCDVLEHVENPFEFMRYAREIAPFMVVRQPLQGDFGIYRKSGYSSCIEGNGHIQFFNKRSFLAIANMCGWEKHSLEIVPPWKLNARFYGNTNLLKIIIFAISKDYSSLLFSGFYLNGSFERSDGRKS